MACAYFTNESRREISTSIRSRTEQSSCIANWNRTTTTVAMTAVVLPRSPSFLQCNGFTLGAAINCSVLWGGGGQGGLNLPLPVPFNPGSRPVFLGSRPFAFFRLRNIAQCCVIFPFFSRFPPPWESRFPPPLLPPPVHLPPPFLRVSLPPVPPPPHCLLLGHFCYVLIT